MNSIRGLCAAARRLLLAIVVAVTLVGSIAVAGAAAAAGYTYDASHRTRVEVDVTSAAVGEPPQFSDRAHRRAAQSSVITDARTNPPYSLVATNNANGARLNARLTAEEIAGGHAYEKHVVSQGEFPGIRTRGQFADMIENIINNYDEMKCLSGGRVAYWRDGVVVIRNPSAVDGGTAFVPRDGCTYFEGL